MTGWWTGVGVGMLSAVVAAWLVPGWAMRRLLPVLERSGRDVTNYRGREVVLGLGVVWLVWAWGTPPCPLS